MAERRGASIVLAYLHNSLSLVHPAFGDHHGYIMFLPGVLQTVVTMTSAVGDSVCPVAASRYSRLNLYSLAAH